jgi:hypothetical protein
LLTTDFGFFHGLSLAPVFFARSRGFTATDTGRQIPPPQPTLAAKSALKYFLTVFQFTPDALIASSPAKTSRTRNQAGNASS